MKLKLYTLDGNHQFHYLTDKHKMLRHCQQTQQQQMSLSQQYFKIFINNKSTKFCQISLSIKRLFVHKKRSGSFFLRHGVHVCTVATA